LWRSHGQEAQIETVNAEACLDAEVLGAYQEQHTTVEPGFRWIKNPAAISPVWLEKPERIAALAMLTAVGLLVYSIIQRQVRLYPRNHLLICDALGLDHAWYEAPSEPARSSQHGARRCPGTSPCPSAAGGPYRSSATAS
jgi:hypothetical protein